MLITAESYYVFVLCIIFIIQSCFLIQIYFYIVAMCLFQKQKPNIIFLSGFDELPRNKMKKHKKKGKLEKTIEYTDHSTLLGLLSYTISLKPAI